MALCVTTEGEQHIRRVIEEYDWLNADLIYADLVSPSDRAFSDEASFWSTDEEMMKAKAVCTDLGASIYPDNPLGFGNQALLIVFPSNCPNNSLPILHSPSAIGSNRSWRPLFARMIH